MSRVYTYEHKGYVLQQSGYNWHYMIFDEATSGVVMHVQCDRKLTKAEAVKRIERYLKMKGVIEESEKNA